jgi:hypothetical protein
MATCNWCQLESQNEDTCDWCKRPIRRNFSIYGDVAMLREDDEAPGDRVTMMFGAVIGVALMGLIVFALINYRGGSSGTSDPMSRIADTEKTWTAERSAPAPAPATPAPPTKPNVPVAAASTAPRSIGKQAPTPPPNRTASTSPTSGYALASSAILRDGEIHASSSTTGFYLEKASLKVGKDDEGTYAISGDVRIGNTSGGRISEITFKLVANKRDFALEMGDQDPDLGNGASRTYRLWAKGIPAEMIQASDATIVVSGSGVDGPYQDRISLK